MNRIHCLSLALLVSSLPATALAESVGPPENDARAPGTAAPVVSAGPATATPVVPPTPAAPPSATPTATKEPPPIELLGPKMGKRLLTWDANIDGAYGYIFGSKKTDSGFVRARGGLLWVRDPNFFSLGLTYELSPESVATVGVQGEAMHLDSGMWIQVGGQLDLEHKARPSGIVAVGWSILGVETQVRSYEGFGVAPAVFGKLRIPLGVIGFALTTGR